MNLSRISITAFSIIMATYAYANASWNYEKKEDPFTDKFVYSRAINILHTQDGMFAIALVCEGDLHPLMIFPGRTPTEYPSYDIKYRLDKSSPKDAHWAGRYSWDNSVIINDDDWKTISSQVNEDSHLKIGFKYISNILDFDMSGFTEAAKKVAQDCQSSGTR